jgi:hypothetical protein
MSGLGDTQRPAPGRSLRRRLPWLLGGGVAILAVAVLVLAFAGVWPFGSGGDGDGPARAARESALAARQSALAGAATATASPAAPVSPSAAGSPTPTNRPAVTTPAPNRPGGKPGTANTGVPAGTKLIVVNGNQTYATSNQVINGLDIHGFVQITGKNVTIKNSIIRGGPNPKCNSSVLWIRADTGASAVIQDSEIAPSNPGPCLDGIWATSSSLVRMNIHGAVDGIKAYDNVTVQDSWVHDLSWFASDPNQGGGATHNDDVQTYEGNRHIVLRHNTLSPGPKGNAAYQVTQDGGKPATDLHIENNWLDGGGCTLNFSHKGGPTPMTGIYVVGNRFGRASQFHCPILLSTQTVLSQNSGNVYDDTGKAIPGPQKHD